MGMIRRYHRCAQGSCPSAIYFCLFHHGAHCEHLIHVKQLFDGEGGKEGRKKKSVRREKMSGGRQGGWKRAVEWKDCFSLISIYSEDVDRAHMLFSLRRPVLYSRLHPFTPGTCPDFFFFTVWPLSSSPEQLGVKCSAKGAPWQQ